MYTHTLTLQYAYPWVCVCVHALSGWCSVGCVMLRHTYEVEASRGQSFGQVGGTQEGSEEGQAYVAVVQRVGSIGGAALARTQEQLYTCTGIISNS